MKRVGTAKKEYPELYYAAATGVIPFTFMYEGVGNMWNYSMINDPVYNDVRVKITAAYWNEAERQRLVREVMASHALDMVYYILLPDAYVYYFWQPWFKGYNFETHYYYQTDFWYKYVWLDLDLREKMTGRR